VRGRVSEKRGSRIWSGICKHTDPAPTKPARERIELMGKTNGSAGKASRSKAEWRAHPCEAAVASPVQSATETRIDVTRRDLPLRYAPVAPLGQTFVFPLERMRYRAGFVRSGSVRFHRRCRTRQARPLKRFFGRGIVEGGRFLGMSYRQFS